MSTLIVEDGTGKADADSYASIDWIDAFFLKVGVPIAWEKSSNHPKNPQKDQAARVATRTIDARWGRRFPGDLVRPFDQRLLFPRIGLARYDSDEIPDEVMEATAILAAKLRQGIDLSPDVTEVGAVTQDRVTIGPITISKSFGGSGKSTTARVFTEVEEILSKILTPVGYMERS